MTKNLSFTRVELLKRSTVVFVNPGAIVIKTLELAEEYNARINNNRKNTLRLIVSSEARDAYEGRGV
jgi:hypothetical protein